MNNINPTIREQLQATKELAGTSFIIFAIALAVTIVRFIYVLYAGHDSILDFFGFNSPWIFAWVVQVFAGLSMSIHGDDIAKLANERAAKRLREQYSKIH